MNICERSLSLTYCMSTPLVHFQNPDRERKIFAWCEKHIGSPNSQECSLQPPSSKGATTMVWLLWAFKGRHQQWFHPYKLISISLVCLKTYETHLGLCIHILHPQFQVLYRLRHIFVQEYLPLCNTFWSRRFCTPVVMTVLSKLTLLKMHLWHVCRL